LSKKVPFSQTVACFSSRVLGSSPRGGANREKSSRIVELFCVYNPFQALHIDQLERFTVL